MFHKIIDVLKEVFWIKKTKKKRPAAKKQILVKSKVKPKTKIKTKLKPKVKPVKATVKKTVKLPVLNPNLIQIGVITHYFERIKVAVIKVKVGSVIIGDKIHIIGTKTKFIQKVWSMQIDRQDVKVAKKGDDIGLKLDKMVVVGDLVYK